MNILKNQKLKEILWNAVGAGLSACQAAILLIFISRKQPIEIAGIVTIAFAVANIVFAIAKYGVRNFQVTDINEEYNFGDYLFHRIVVCAITLVGAFLFLIYQKIFGGYSLEKIAIMLEIIILRIIDGIEDVYIGHFQLKNHFLEGAKLMAIRKIIVTMSICILIFASIRMSIAGIIGVLVAIISEIILIRQVYYKAGGYIITAVNWKQVVALFKICLPLAVGTTLSIYVGNIPKYVIDKYMTEEIQAVFGYIMLPVFVLTLLSQFIYTPFVKDFGVKWSERDISGFIRKICFHCGIIFLLSIIFVTALTWIGLPILSLLYNIDLAIYQREYFLLLIGGCIYAMDFYFLIPLTAMRKQKQIAIGYLTVVIISILLSRQAVFLYGFTGVAYLYLLINFILLAWCIGLVGFYIFRENAK